MELIDPGHRIPDASRWRQSVADYIRDVAAQGAKLSPSTSEHPKMLSRLAEFVSSVEVHDQRLSILRKAQSLRGEGRPFTGEWTPAHKARRLLAIAGQGPPEWPSSDEFLTELAATAVDDLHADWARNAQERSDQERRQIEQLASDRIEQEVTRAQNSEAQARADLETVKAELAETKKTVEYLTDRQVDGTETEKPKAKKPAKKSKAVVSS